MNGNMPISNGFYLTTNQGNPSFNGFFNTIIEISFFIFNKHYVTIILTEKEVKL